ncbi:hypothetical protein [Streptomyces sp. 4F14]|uniref:hypothetical protein n=1 Tax=Streptomyces sp. 4F14 TaxID=3394380 RepID=UPI003A85DF6C
MDFTDWAIDLALIGLVLLQLRGRRLTARTLLLPVGLVCWAGVKYLKDVPTTSHDLMLIVPAVAIGLALGTGAGATTKVYRDKDGDVFARATLIAAVLWVLGVGFRMAFQLYSTHGGGPTIARFSLDHHIDLTAWAPAVVLMAFAEVLARTGVVWARGLTIRHRTLHQPA